MSFQDLKPVAVVEGEPTVTCLQCNSMTKVEKRSCVFQCNLTFEDEQPLALPLDALQNYHEDVLELYQKNLKSFKESLLFLD